MCNVRSFYFPENESDPNNSRPPADDLVPAVKNAQSPDNDDPPDGGPVEESTDTNNPPQNAALVMPDNNGIINQMIHPLYVCVYVIKFPLVKVYFYKN